MFTLILAFAILLLVTKRSPFFVMGLVMLYASTYATGGAWVAICAWALVFLGTHGVLVYLKRQRHQPREVKS